MHNGWTKVRNKLKLTYITVELRKFNNKSIDVCFY